MAPFRCNLFSFILLAFVVLNFREHLRLFSYIRGYNLGLYAKYKGTIRACDLPVPGVVREEVEGLRAVVEDYASPVGYRPNIYQGEPYP